MNDGRANSCPTSSVPANRPTLPPTTTPPRPRRLRRRHLGRRPRRVPERPRTRKTRTDASVGRVVRVDGVARTLASTSSRLFARRRRDRPTRDRATRSTTMDDGRRTGCRVRTHFPRRANERPVDERDARGNDAPFASHYTRVAVVSLMIGGGGVVGRDS